MKAKIIFISFVVCCMALYINSEAANNNTIVNDNSSWATLSYGLGSEAVPCCVQTRYYFFDGDSVFNGKTYKQTFYYQDEHHTERLFSGLMREENLKTYFISKESGIETILYDFSLEKGDTFEYLIGAMPTSIILSVLESDSVLINNEWKKRLIVSYEVTDTIIENIGSLRGLFYPLMYGVSGAFHGLLCHFQNNELIYKNPNYSECYYDKAEDFTSTQTTKIEDFYIFPNPVDDLVTVSSTNTVSRIDIFDVLGKQICSLDNKNTVDVSSFPKGLYLFKVYGTEGEYSLFKIIKK